MKIRMGFVSNSSASSFCIYGICFDGYRNDLSKFISEEEMEEYENDRYDWFDKKIGKGILSHHSDPNGDYHWIGVSWRSVRDDQTGLQFKEEVKAAVKQLFGAELAEKCATHEEAWGQ